MDLLEKLFQGHVCGWDTTGGLKQAGQVAVATECRKGWMNTYVARGEFNSGVGKLCLKCPVAPLAVFLMLFASPLIA